MPSTKGIRLHTELRERFESTCAANLLDERAVIEAWLLRFLEASDAEKQQAATRYMQWLLDQAKPDKRRGGKKSKN